MNSHEPFPKTKDFLFILLLIGVFGAIGGFIYETIFYRIAWGYFVKRGSTFGPWIPIYGVGAIFMTLSIWKWQKNPLAVFLISFFVCGILEFIVGFVLFHCFNGLRLWDYNTEPWNFGNIGGYVCLRSVGIFGLFGFLLFYGVIPTILWLKKHIPARAFQITSVTLAGIFVCDIIVHMILKGLA
ncbi:MAG: putative ABC transporter permease [Treponema sp.]|nr:putative ABC transporter permease [Treponema sp.]